MHAMQTFVLTLVVLYYAMHVADEWRERPRLVETADRRPTKTAIWICLLMAWLALHLAPIAFYGNELIERLVS